MRRALRVFVWQWGWAAPLLCAAMALAAFVASALSGCCWLVVAVDVVGVTGTCAVVPWWLWLTRKYPRQGDLLGRYEEDVGG